MIKKVKIRRQEINYTYNDANIIPEVNNYLMSGELDMKLIKLTLNVFDNKIRIVFRSSFEVRKEISDKLRELDTDVAGSAIKRKLFFKRLITMKGNKILEEAAEESVIDDVCGKLVEKPESELNFEKVKDVVEHGTDMQVVSVKVSEDS